jgi:DNA primase
MNRDVETCHNNLPERIKSWLYNERKLSEEVVKRFKLGWDGKSITIPICDKDNNFLFFKFRKDPQDNSELPKYWYSADSSAEIYGWEHLITPKPKLFITEGELDRLLLETNHLPAITSTSGAGTFKEEWAQLINTLPNEIFICYDNDEAGRHGAGRVGELIPKAKIIRIPKEEGVKDITDLVRRRGIQAFKNLLPYAKTYEQIKEECRLAEIQLQKSVYPEMYSAELIEILGLTIKKDNANKLITFLCELSAYTEQSQFNLSFNAPSSTGKSYLPLEVASYFPKEDVVKLGYVSSRAFFHDVGQYQKELNRYFIDLSRKVLIFLDQPHNELLQHLRPLLSHDQQEIHIKIADRSEKGGFRTKNIFIKGFPAVVFCSSGLKIDEQESTRFLLLSPEMNQEKIRQGIQERIRKEANSEQYYRDLDNNPKRQILIQRIIAIKEVEIKDVIINFQERIEQEFLKTRPTPKPRHMRDIGRVICIIKAFALLNLWHRHPKDGYIIAEGKDLEEAFKLWNDVSESQEYNLPPYIYNFYKDVVLPIYDGHSGITRKDLLHRYYEIHGQVLSDWLLRQQILPSLDTAGLIMQERDPAYKSRILIYPSSRNSE